MYVWQPRFQDVLKSTKPETTVWYADLKPMGYMVEDFTIMVFHTIPNRVSIMSLIKTLFVNSTAMLPTLNVLDADMDTLLTRQASA